MLAEARAQALYLCGTRTHDYSRDVRLIELGKLSLQGLDRPAGLERRKCGEPRATRETLRGGTDAQSPANALEERRYADRATRCGAQAQTLAAQPLLNGFLKSRRHQQLSAALLPLRSLTTL